MRVILNTKLLMCANKAGIGTYVSNLSRELKEAGVDVVPTLGQTSYTLLNTVGRMSANMRSALGKFYPSFIKTIGDSVYRHLNQKETDISANSLYHEPSLEPLPPLKAKSVFNVYDLSYIHYPHYFVEGFAERARVNSGRNAAAVDRVIVNTHFIKEETIELLKVPEDKIDVIPLAPPEFYRAAQGKSAARDHVKRYTEKEYILYVGTVEPRKNLKTLIRAFKEVHTKYDVALIIAGGLGWLYDDVVGYPEELGIKKDVIFTNYVDEETLKSLYSRAAAFVYPSVYEGFGIPPLEAMCSGVPAIVSDIPPHREVSGDAALFFAPHDHGALSDAIVRILTSDSLRAEVRQRGLKKASEYTWRRVAAETIRTYEKALEN